MTSAHDRGWATGLDANSGQEEPPVVIRDRRRIDPRSGEVRPDAAAAAAAAASGTAAGPGIPGPAGGGVGGQSAGGPSPDPELVASLRSQVLERTADLQRLKAEYDNYRRRVERDRQLVVEQATGRLLGAMLPTLDDIVRARDHGDLEGPFKAVAESFETALESLGLERYGSSGDEFDPLVHEALMHSYREDVTAPTCVDVFRPGYSYAGRVLRVAQVSVAEPAETAEPTELTEPVAAADEVDADQTEAAGLTPDDTGSLPGSGGGPTVDG